MCKRHVLASLKPWLMVYIKRVTSNVWLTSFFNLNTNKCALNLSKSVLHQDVGIEVCLHLMMLINLSCTKALIACFIVNYQRIFASLIISEKIDPVRFIANCSTGKLGYTVAKVAGFFHICVFMAGATRTGV